MRTNLKKAKNEDEIWRNTKRKRKNAGTGLIVPIKSNAQ